MSLLLAWAVAAGAAAPTFDPRETFAPLALPEPVSAARSANGAPGPGYWQNGADYDLNVRLDAKAHTLGGTETIAYVNNSPDALPTLWLQMDQDVYRRGARAEAASGLRAQGAFSDGFVVASVEADEGRGFRPVATLRSDTRMRVTLAQALKPRGGAVRLRLRYSYTVPGAWGGRTSVTPSPDGEIFDIAQWYPRMAVYDDARGWDTLPYVAQEFYLEYGRFDYAVTAPADMIVAGSGELTNPAEVLAPQQRRRLEAARESDATIAIRTAAEVGDPASRPHPASGELTWRFRMDHTRDVAFAASRAFVWDAARIRLPQGRTALAMSVYPAQSGGPQAWGRSTEYLKDAVERFSARWRPYPWPVAVNVGGGVSGMEYPGVCFDGADDRGKALFWITAHEIGHSWFPMLVGFDERRDAWMDEGFNTFIDTFESDEFQAGVYGPKRDSEYAPGGGNPVEEIAPLLADPAAPPILTRADLIDERYRHPVTYFKSALGLRLLRDQILGPARFDPAFRKFIADWAYKHPKPSDFFRAMQSEGGEDLAWWWRGWYVQNWTLDLAVTGVAYVDGDPAQGARVTVQNRDKLVMPSVLQVRYADGTVLRVALPVESWLLQGDVAVALPAHGRVVAAEVDPDRALPDRDRGNNLFTPPVGAPAAPPPRATAKTKTDP